MHRCESHETSSHNDYDDYTYILINEMCTTKKPTENYLNCKIFIIMVFLCGAALYQLIINSVL